MTHRMLGTLLLLSTALGCHHSDGLGLGYDAAQPAELDLAQPADLSPATPTTFSPDVTLGELQPQVERDNVTGVIATPTVVAVTYDDDPYRTDAEAFFPQYAASAAWATHTSEYGVGPLTVGTPRHLGPAPAMLTDDEVRLMLQTNLASATAPWGAADRNTTYQFFVPETTTFGLQSDGQSYPCCVYYGGYHDDTIVNGVPVSYAIVCECADSGGSTTPLQDITNAASHELVEAVTDAFAGNRGYRTPSHEFYAFTLLTQGELGDMCEYAPNRAWKPADMDYTIQRSWSNAAAAAGHDPCVGDGDVPYYEAIPYLPDHVEVGHGLKSKSLNIAVGATATMIVRVFSDVPGGSVTIDLSPIPFGFDRDLEFEVPPGPFAAGTDVPVKVTVLSPDPDNTLGPFELFVLTTTPVNGGNQTFYYGMIGQP